jgi:hypothetical protein
MGADQHCLLRLSVFRYGWKMDSLGKDDFLRILTEPKNTRPQTTTPVLPLRAVKKPVPETGITFPPIIEPRQILLITFVFSLCHWLIY